MKDPPFVFHLKKNCEKKRLYSIIENKKAIVVAPPLSDGTLRASVRSYLLYTTPT